MQKKYTVLSFLTICQPLLPIIKAIGNLHGAAYVVGGSVRDLILDRECKDFDVEVHGLTLDQLEGVLKQFGHVELIGKKFGVLLLAGMPVDWSIPRRDSKGRKPTVAFDPTMTFEDAARRRDLTMNAMGINLQHVAEQWDDLAQEKDLEGFIKKLVIVDPYGGRAALARKELCAVDETLFLEDPLRFFRVIQFIGRFEIFPDVQLVTICKNMPLEDSGTDEPIAKERVFEEVKKLFLQSRKPSLGLRWLQKLGRIEELLPELYSLIGAVQRPDYHPEGDVFEHTMQALDAAASLLLYEKSELFSADEEKLVVMLTVLCHDMGKPETTCDQLHARGHDLAGVPVARSFLDRFCMHEHLKKMVCKLVKHHMNPLGFLKNNAGPAAYKRLARKLSPELSIRQLALVAHCDWRGRNGKGHEPLPDDGGNHKEFTEAASSAGVLLGPEAPILLGRHIIDDVASGKEIGKILERAYEIQIEENITDVDVLKKRVL